MVNVAIMGHGTVGSGVAEIIINNCDVVEKGIKDKINVKYILDLRDFDNLPYSDKFIKDFNIILNDAEIDIVVEVMGGITPAYDFVKASLLSGKSVVTSNKELVAAKGAELLQIAEEKNVNFLFEASVGGGIPVIRPIAQCLAANSITEVKGILNGTTNYILDKMIVDNMKFEDALKLAQDKGYAEKNPAADIEGHDACRKICILAALAFGSHVYPEDVKTEGITDITLNDVECADNFNCVIKLIASAKKLSNGKITATVRPTVVSRESMLSNVNGVFNAIMVTGDSVGDVIFYGPGAGKLPTASAVVADVIDCAKHKNARKYLSWEDAKEGYVISANEPERFYVYTKSNAEGFEKMYNTFTSLFDDNCSMTNEIEHEIIFITEPLTKEQVMEKVNKLGADTVKVMHTIL